MYTHKLKCGCTITAKASTALANVVSLTVTSHRQDSMIVELTQDELNQLVTGLELQAAKCKEDHSDKFAAIIKGFNRYFIPVYDVEFTKLDGSNLYWTKDNKTENGCGNGWWDTLESARQAAKSAGFKNVVFTDMEDIHKKVGYKVYSLE